jgi:ComF family protein
MAVAQTLVDGAWSGVRRLVDLLMPPTCMSCGVEVATPLSHCAACWSALPMLAGAQCDSCGVPLPIAWQTESHCLGCLAEPPRFDRARAPFLYDGPARQTVLAFKHGREAYAAPMATAMLRAWNGDALGDHLVVPVPLHRWRLWSRGYNQAALLARAVAQQAGAGLDLDALVRLRNTPSSRGLNRAARRRNVEGAFRVSREAAARLKGRKLLLVDDVMTSGATASAAAGALRRAGAMRVDVLIYARVAATDATPYLATLEGQEQDAQD